MLVAIFVLFLLFVATATDATTSPMTRLFHRECVRKHCSRKKEASIGSLIRVQHPTADRVSRWFASSRDNNIINHDSVGMTNPYVDNENVMQVVAKGVGSSNKDDNNSDNWWPPCYPKKGWKLLRYRQRVGFGLTCYNAVRDKVLEWEFDNDDSSKGIVQIRRSCTQQHQPILQRRDDDAHPGYVVVHNVVFGDGDLYDGGPSCQNAHKVWLGPGGRRLATYTQVGLLFHKWCKKKTWAPRVYVVNPVSVIYNLVDQRAPGTTYSSTAYATVRGHWLRGEERVSVFRRDGSGDVHVEILSYSKPGNNMWGKIIWPFVGHLQGQFFESQMNALQDVATKHSNSNEVPAVMMHVKARRGLASLKRDWMFQ